MTPGLLAREAEKLIGCPFRLHGRDPDSGIDCIGLLAAAMAGAGRPIVLPTGYPLRLNDLTRWLPDPAQCGFAVADMPFEPGDVVLTRPGPGQVHLAIAGLALSWIHAHAGLRRVVSQTEIGPGSILHHWRLSPTN